MGDYTELIFGAKLKKDTPDIVIDTLRHMCGQIDKPVKLPDHKLFAGGIYWDGLFMCSSYYFGVNESNAAMWKDDIDGCWHISTRANLKNYDDEIELFCDWIKPHIESGSGCGDFYAIECFEQGLPKIYSLDPDRVQDL